MRKLFAAAFLFLCASAVHAQGAYTAGPFNTGGLLYVCTTPVTTTPCTSLASIYPTSALTGALSNPYPVNAGQAITIYMASGQYAVQMPAAGFSQIITIGGSGGAATTAVVGQAFQLGPQCAVTAGNCYHAAGTGAFDCGVSWATASPHAITLSSYASRQFTQADVGTIAWGAAYQCGAVSESAGSIALHLTQTTIASVTDATHATVTGSFTSNCTAGGEGGCTFFWGDTDEQAVVNAAFLAATTNTNGVGCGTLNFQGIIFVSLPIVNTTTNCLGPGNAGQSTRYSYSVVGNGENSSQIVMIPNFSGATCPTGVGAIFGQVNGGGSQGVYFSNFQVQGGGMQIQSVPGGGCRVLAVGADGLAQNVAVMNVSINTANVVGFAFTGIAGEPAFSYHVEVVSSGSTSCSFGSNTNHIYPYCVGGSTNLGLTGTGNVYTYQGNFGFDGAGTGVAVCVASGNVWYSDHDQFYFENAAQKLINGISGCTMWLDHDQINSTTASATALNIASGMTVHLRSTQVTASGTTATGIANAGTIYNDGDNKVTGTTAAYSGAGTAIVTASGESGTIACTTSAATITFKNVYAAAPAYVIQDRTTAGAVTQTSENATTLVLGCPGASDNLNYVISPNPF